METRKLRAGQPITPEQFEQLTDDQLACLVPRAHREFFPGKDFCAPIVVAFWMSGSALSPGLLEA